MNTGSRMIVCNIGSMAQRELTPSAPKRPRMPGVLAPVSSSPAMPKAPKLTTTPKAPTASSPSPTGPKPSTGSPMAPRASSGPATGTGLKSPSLGHRIFKAYRTLTGQTHKSGMGATTPTASSPSSPAAAKPSGGASNPAASPIWHPNGSTAPKQPRQPGLPRQPGATATTKPHNAAVTTARTKGYSEHDRHTDLASLHTQLAGEARQNGDEGAARRHENRALAHTQAAGRSSAPSMPKKTASTPKTSSPKIRSPRPSLSVGSKKTASTSKTSSPKTSSPKPGSRLSRSAYYAYPKVLKSAGFGEKRRHTDLARSHLAAAAKAKASGDMKGFKRHMNRANLHTTVAKNWKPIAA